MKNKIIMATALIALLIAILCGCNNKLEPGDSTILYNPKTDGMEIIKDMDAYELIKQAYNTYQTTSQYKMEVDFIFKGKVLGLNLYQNTFQKIIRNNNNYYEYYVVAGRGLQVPTGDGDEFKYIGATDTSQARYIRGDKQKIKLIDDKVTADFSGVAWGDFDSNNEAEGINTPIDKVNRYKKDFHQYNWLNEKYISKKTDRQVYMKDGRYFCTIKINTLEGNMRTIQPEVVKAIEVATGGKYDKFNEDTRMVTEIEKVGDSYRFVQFILMEDYSGINESIGKNAVNVSQQYWHKFYYDTESLVFPERNCLNYFS